ncbi:response regulator transcription factor [Streptomyces tuirus]|uniref:Response regulator transcription factor n=1 Tax=Streptomyces tuirus TaxID=68278 RepID=A0A941J2Q4_9ACTN|nr:response regulator transcription factor [Streptomyces tuirus]
MAISSPYGSIRERPALTRGDGQHLLVVVREPEPSELLPAILELAGYRVTLAGSGTEALARVERRRFDLVVLDGELPDVAELGRRRPSVLAHRPPTLVLTVCDSLPGLLPELGPGEKDYVTKPFRVAEVLARIHVLLRASVPDPLRADGLGYGDLILDDARCRARRGRRALDLTPAEYRLLRHLLVNAHRVLSKEQIGRYVWGDSRGGNAIEQLVSRLRRKVDRDAPALIHTHRGFGYWLGRADVEP